MSTSVSAGVSGSGSGDRDVSMSLGDRDTAIGSNANESASKAATSSIPLPSGLPGMSSSNVSGMTQPLVHSSTSSTTNTSLSQDSGSSSGGTDVRMSASGTGDHSSRSPSTSGERSKRQPFSDEQLNILRGHFQYSQYISRDQAPRIAEETGLTPKQVKEWYNNHRKSLSRHKSKSVGGTGTSSPNTPFKSAQTTGEGHTGMPPLPMDYTGDAQTNGGFDSAAVHGMDLSSADGGAGGQLHSLVPPFYGAAPHQPRQQDLHPLCFLCAKEDIKSSLAPCSKCIKYYHPSCMQIMKQYHGTPVSTTPTSSSAEATPSTTSSDVVPATSTATTNDTIPLPSSTSATHEGGDSSSSSAANALSEGNANASVSGDVESSGDDAMSSATSGKGTSEAIATGLRGEDKVVCGWHYCYTCHAYHEPIFDGANPVNLDGITPYPILYACIGCPRSFCDHHVDDNNSALLADGSSCRLHLIPQQYLVDTRRYWDNPDGNKRLRKQAQSWAEACDIYGPRILSMLRELNESDWKPSNYHFIICGDCVTHNEAELQVLRNEKQTRRSYYALGQLREPVNAHLFSKSAKKRPRSTWEAASTTPGRGTMGVNFNNNIDNNMNDINVNNATSTTTTSRKVENAGSPEGNEQLIARFVQENRKREQQQEQQGITTASGGMPSYTLTPQQRTHDLSTASTSSSSRPTSSKTPRARRHTHINTQMQSPLFTTGYFTKQYGVADEDGHSMIEGYVCQLSGCKRGNKPYARSKKAGYGSLINHLRSEHQAEYDQYKNMIHDKQQQQLHRRRESGAGVSGMATTTNSHTPLRRSKPPAAQSNSTSGTSRDQQIQHQLPLPSLPSTPLQSNDGANPPQHHTNGPASILTLHNPTARFEGTGQFATPQLLPQSASSSNINNNPPLPQLPESITVPPSSSNSNTSHSATRAGPVSQPQSYTSYHLPLPSVQDS